MGAFMFAMQQAAPSIDSVFPTSVGGWVAMIAGLVAVVLLLYDRLRGSGKLDADMNNRVTEVTRKQEVTDRDVCGIEGHMKAMDKNISEVQYDLRGSDGQNGARGAIRGHGEEIAAIKKRLGAMDVIAALFKAEREEYKGNDRRRTVRRALDEKLRDMATLDDDDGN